MDGSAHPAGRTKTKNLDMTANVCHCRRRRAKQAALSQERSVRCLSCALSKCLSFRSCDTTSLLSTGGRHAQLHGGGRAGIRQEINSSGGGPTHRASCRSIFAPLLLFFSVRLAGTCAPSRTRQTLLTPQTCQMLLVSTWLTPPVHEQM